MRTEQDEEKAEGSKRRRAEERTHNHVNVAVFAERRSHKQLGILEVGRVGVGSNHTDKVAYSPNRRSSEEERGKTRSEHIAREYHGHRLVPGRPR
jgi:hypothetical protein